MLVVPIEFLAICATPKWHHISALIALVLGQD